MYIYINIYTFILERSACSVTRPCALSALELFFCDFSAARPRFVARLVNIYTFTLERSACSVKHPCALSALELFFCDFSAARPRFVARLARSDSPQSRGPCPRADPPSPRPSRSASEVARSRLRGLPHAPQSQPCFFTTTSLLGSSYSPAVTLFFFLLFLVLDRHDYRVTACVHRRDTGRTSRIATLLCCLSVLASRVVILFCLYWPGEIRRKWGIS